MAGVTTVTTVTYPTDALMSPSCVDGPQQQWDYSVPIVQDGANSYSKPQSSHDSSSVHAKSRDRSSNLSQSSSRSKQAHMHESGYLTTARGRSEHSRSRTASETGASRDIHGQESTVRSVSSSREPVEGHHYNASYRKGDTVRENGKRFDPDDENWIHRDKLAKIESEELQQAAIMFHRRARAGSEKSATRGRSHESQHSGVNGSYITTPPGNDYTEPWPQLREEQDYFNSRVPAESDDPIEEERRNWDLRRPEEIAEDDAASGIYRNPGLRKSSSRIPIAMTSPVPISPDQLGREYPVHRTRALTNGGDEDSATSTKPRRASEPITTEDADDTPNSFSTPSTSRPGSRGNALQSSSAKKTPTKTTPGSTNRKTSAPPTTRKTTPKNRTTSGNSNSGQRPVTRSGETRPINRPEGDPPWLATMYKPDPRLPPDQQILPTHARRMQQEQWEKDGKAPTAYDREFAPLAIHPDGPPPVSPQPEKPREPEEEQKENEKPEGATWPLNSSKSPEPGTRPGTATGAGTGYSPMPKLQNMPTVGLTPKWSPPVVTAQEPPKKEKGCGCCIVM